MSEFINAIPESYILLKNNCELPKACLVNGVIWIVKPGENTN